MVVHMRLLAFLLVFLASCARSVVPVSYVPPRALVVHADTTFTPAERSVIQGASKELMSQIGMRVEITYDLDFGKIEQLSRFADVTLMLRIDRSDQRTKDMDVRYHGVTFAWTQPWPPTRIYIASDVLIDGQEILYLHVVMHEFLHAVGCDHVSDPNAVLFWQTNLGHQAVKLTEADRVELLRHTDRASR